MQRSYAVSIVGPEPPVTCFARHRNPTKPISWQQFISASQNVGTPKFLVQSDVHDRTPKNERNPDCNGGHEHQNERRRLANREAVAKGCTRVRERATGSKTPSSPNVAVTDQVVLVAPHEQLAGRRERHSRNEWSVDRPIGRHCEAGASERDITTCLLYTSPSPRDGLLSRMPSSA